MDLKNIKEKIFQENGVLAWIVCLGMLFSNIIVQGINNTFGELIGTIIEEFNSDFIRGRGMAEWPVKGDEEHTETVAHRGCHPW